MAMCPKIVSVLVFACLLAPGLFGQDVVRDLATLNEDFQLNIQNKRIVETAYDSSLEVSLISDSRPPVALRVGASVKTGKITLTLRNVFGDVRFRASLESVLNQINLRHSPNER